MAPEVVPAPVGAALVLELEPPDGKPLPGPDGVDNAVTVLCEIVSDGLSTEGSDTG